MKKDRAIKDIDDFSEYVSDMLHEMLQSLKEEVWATYEAVEDEEDSGLEFYWTQRAMGIIERYLDRLYKIAVNNFKSDAHHLNIYSPLYVEI